MSTSSLILSSSTTSQNSS